MIRSFVASALSMLATLAIAYGFDRWIAYQQRIARRDFTMVTAYTWVIIAGLVTFLVWLALGWFSLVKSRRILAISIIYVAVGLLAFLWYPLALVFPFFWAVHLFHLWTIPSNLQYSGLFVAVLGVLTLLSPKQKPT